MRLFLFTFVFDQNGTTLYPKIGKELIGSQPPSKMLVENERKKAIF